MINLFLRGTDNTKKKRKVIRVHFPLYADFLSFIHWDVWKNNKNHNKSKVGIKWGILRDQNYFKI